MKERTSEVLALFSYELLAPCVPRDAACVYVPQVNCAGFINSDLPGLPQHYHQTQGKPLR